ncbi:MAG TPA: hypothetical protein VHA82_04315 [Ramlibacter sp.]|nr:hypothetical protein [Ramlibacter sp.]
MTEKDAKAPQRSTSRRLFASRLSTNATHRPRFGDVAVHRLLRGANPFGEDRALAVGIIDGLAFKGECYSAFAQMLGTRSVAERLVQLITRLAEIDGVQGRQHDQRRLLALARTGS